MSETSRLEIRPARLPADGAAIVGLYGETAQWHAEQWPEDIRSMDALARSILPQLSNLDDNTFFQVAECGGALVGLISAKANPPPAGSRNRYDGPVVWVADVVVTASSRRQGVGARLMAAVETWARSRGAGSITLSVHAGNNAACALYERNGYRTTEYRMRKDL